MQLVRITAPHFCAGLEVGGRFAPILHYMRGWTLGRVLAYAARKGWQAETLGE